MKTIHQVLGAKALSIVSITPDTLIYDALVIMAEKHIGALLVLEGDHLAGIFSERDYAREVMLKGRSSRTSFIKEVMTTNVITVSPKNTVEECMSLMSGKRVRHLPVIEDGKVTGILSIGDLVKETIAEQEAVIKQLESYIQGEKSI
jgi:CBS domain-containing protein